MITDKLQPVNMKKETIKLMLKVLELIGLAAVLVFMIMSIVKG